jgi:hypothetical protein
VTLSGASGFHALMSRAHAKACLEEPWLKVIKVERDGCLEVVKPDGLDYSSEEARKAQENFVAHLLGLLNALIGAALTRRIVLDAWPDMFWEEEPGETHD